MTDYRMLIFRWFLSRFGLKISGWSQADSLLLCLSSAAVQTHAFSGTGSKRLQPPLLLCPCLWHGGRRARRTRGCCGKMHRFTQVVSSGHSASSALPRLSSPVESGAAMMNLWPQSVCVTWHSDVSARASLARSLLCICGFFHFILPSSSLYLSCVPSQSLRFSLQICCICGQALLIRAGGPVPTSCLFFWALIFTEGTLKISHLTFGHCWGLWK